MQNIINFDNSIIRNGKIMLDVSDAIRDKQISIGTIYELLGYAENEANIPAIRKAVAAVRSGKILPTSSESGQKKNNRTENWYKSHYNTFKAKNEKHLRNALTALRETGLTNPEITQKTGYFKVNELIGATPKPLLVARRERINAERREKMLALRKQGMNKTQIAKALGVSTAMVNKILGKYTDEERKDGAKRQPRRRQPRGSHHRAKQTPSSDAQQQRNQNQRPTIADDKLVLTFFVVVHDRFRKIFQSGNPRGTPLTSALL